MNANLDAELCRKYPHVFADRNGDMRSTSMMWGFECGDGWYQLLDKAAAELELLIVGYIAVPPAERNPFPWWMFTDWDGRYWAIRHPVKMQQVVTRWIKAEIWPETTAPWWPRAAQVKEKYGTLRFYMTSGTDEMYKVIHRAEKQSAITCEQCGKKGKLRGGGWLYTACTKHIKRGA